MTPESTPVPVEKIHEELTLFCGTGSGIAKFLPQDSRDPFCARLRLLSTEHPLTRSQLNQHLALAHLPAISDGLFNYYWLSEPEHTYDLYALPKYHLSFAKQDNIVSFDQFYWGLYRLYVDSLLYFGSIDNAYYNLRALPLEQLESMYRAKRYDYSGMMRRGDSLPLDPISKENRYLISEMACKTYELTDERDSDLLLILLGAFEDLRNQGVLRVTFNELLRYALGKDTRLLDKKDQLELAITDISDAEVESDEDIRQHIVIMTGRFSAARELALKNTKNYLSMAADMDVYVATSMRSGNDFRQMSDFCELVFGRKELSALKLRYFDPTLSAAQGHEDKGLIECLMVKVAKVLLYFAGPKDSYGKDAEAAMALSLGKPVIFYCDQASRRKLFSEIHPLTRLIQFETGVAVGVMVVSSVDDVVLLLNRLFSNKMQYRLDYQKRSGYRLVEGISGSTVRLQTSDELLRETFWNCYHGAD